MSNDELDAAVRKVSVVVALMDVRPSTAHSQVVSVRPRRLQPASGKRRLRTSRSLPEKSVYCMKQEDNGDFSLY
jgi:hypothetical protein